MSNLPQETRNQTPWTENSPLWPFSNTDNSWWINNPKPFLPENPGNTVHSLPFLESIKQLCEGERLTRRIFNKITGKSDRNPITGFPDPDIEKRFIEMEIFRRLYGDATSIIDCLIDTCKTPQEVQAQLQEITRPEVDRINKVSADLHNKIISTLSGHTFDQKSLIELGVIHNRIMDRITAIQSPRSVAFRSEIEKLIESSLGDRARYVTYNCEYYHVINPETSDPHDIVTSAVAEFELVTPKNKAIIPEIRSLIPEHLFMKAIYIEEDKIGRVLVVHPELLLPLMEEIVTHPWVIGATNYFAPYKRENQPQNDPGDIFH